MIGAIIKMMSAIVAMIITAGLRLNCCKLAEIGRRERTGRVLVRVCVCCDRRADEEGAAGEEGRRSSVTILRLAFASVSCWSVSPSNAGLNGRRVCDLYKT